MKEIKWKQIIAIAGIFILLAANIVEVMPSMASEDGQPVVTETQSDENVVVEETPVVEESPQVVEETTSAPEETPQTPEITESTSSGAASSSEEASTDPEGTLPTDSTEGSAGEEATNGQTLAEASKDGSTATEGVSATTATTASTAATTEKSGHELKVSLSFSDDYKTTLAPGESVDLLAGVSLSYDGEGSVDGYHYGISKVDPADSYDEETNTFVASAEGGEEIKVTYFAADAEGNQVDEKEQTIQVTARVVTEVKPGELSISLNAGSDLSIEAAQSADLMNGVSLSLSRENGEVTEAEHAEYQAVVTNVTATGIDYTYTEGTTSLTASAEGGESYVVSYGVKNVTTGELLTSPTASRTITVNKVVSEELTDADMYFSIGGTSGASMEAGDTFDVMNGVSLHVYGPKYAPLTEEQQARYGAYSVKVTGITSTDTEYSYTGNNVITASAKGGETYTVSYAIVDGDGNQVNAANTTKNRTILVHEKETELTDADYTFDLIGISDAIIKPEVEVDAMENVTLEVTRKDGELLGDLKDTFTAKITKITSSDTAYQYKTDATTFTSSTKDETTYKVTYQVYSTLSKGYVAGTTRTRNYTVDDTSKSIATNAKLSWKSGTNAEISGSTLTIQADKKATTYEAVATYQFTVGGKETTSYAAGDVKATMPASIFADEEGKFLGSVKATTNSIAFTAETSDDQLVISNTGSVKGGATCTVTVTYTLTAAQMKTMDAQYTKTGIRGNLTIDKTGTMTSGLTVIVDQNETLLMAETGNETITITVVDADDNNRKLQGARFALYRIDLLNGNKELYEGDYLTDLSGVLDIPVQLNELYYFVEIEAPSNYELENNKQYFMLPDDSKPDEYLSQLTKAKKVVPETDISADKTFVITNRRGIDTALSQISIKKEVRGYHAPDIIPDAFTFEISAITEGAPLSVKTSVKNKGSLVLFGQMSYDKAGDYIYKIEETKKDEGYDLYSIASTPIYAKVSVMLTDDLWYTDVRYYSDVACTKNERSTAVITNYYRTGQTCDLEILKESHGAETPDDAVFTVISRENGYSFDVKYSEFTKDLTSSWPDFRASYYMVNLPEGQYQVIENESYEEGGAQIPNFGLYVDKDNDTNHVTGYDEPASVQLINYYDYAGEYTSLTISKISTVSSLYGIEPPDDTAFTITGSYGYERIVKYSEFTKYGEYHDIHHDGQYFKATYTIRVPKGYYYTVSENEESAKLEGFELKTTGNNTTQLATGRAVEFDITNDYENTVPKGSLRIYKITTTGGYAPTDTSYDTEFIVYNLDDQIVAKVEYGDFTRVELADPDKNTKIQAYYQLDNLPEGTYKVVENNRYKTGYVNESPNEPVPAIVRKNELGQAWLINKFKPDGCFIITKKSFGAATPKDTEFVLTGPYNYETKSNFECKFKYSDFIWNEAKQEFRYEVKSCPEGTYHLSEIAATAEIPGYSLEVINNREEYNFVYNFSNGYASALIENHYTPKDGSNHPSIEIIKETKGAVTSEFTRFIVDGPQGYHKEILYSEFTDGKYILDTMLEGDYTVSEYLGDFPDDPYSPQPFAQIPGYLLTVTGNNAKVTVKNGETAKVKILNTYTPSGFLIIVKNSVGGTTPDDTEFVISGNGYTKTLKYSDFHPNGHGGKNSLAIQVPVGDYTITENVKDAQIASYKLTVEGNNQSVTVPQKLYLNEAIEVKLSNIYTPAGSLEITKISKGIDTPADTVFEIKGPDNYEDTVKYSQFVNGQYTFKDVPVGTYTIYENKESAQVEGYTLTVEGNNQNATITQGGSAKVEITNNYHSDNISFSKVDVGGTEIAGAKIQVLDHSGKVATTADGTKVEWVSEAGKTHIVKGLAAGTYTMHEETAPTGFKVASDIVFTIAEDGKVSSTALQDGKITMVDERTGVLVSKQSDKGDLIGGAILILKDAGGAEVTRWTSESGKNFTIDSLAPGNYTLIEEKVPDGYYKAADIAFRLDASGRLYIGDKEVSAIIMVDDIIPSNPGGGGTTPTPPPTPTTPPTPPTPPTTSTTATTATTTTTTTGTTSEVIPPNEDNSTPPTEYYDVDGNPVDETFTGVLYNEEGGQVRGAMRGYDVRGNILAAGRARTGDESKTMMWLLLCLAACGSLGLYGFGVTRKKRKQDK